MGVVHDVFMLDSLAAIGLLEPVREDLVVAAVSAVEFLTHLGFQTDEIAEVCRQRVTRISRELDTTDRSLFESALATLPGFTDHWSEALAVARRCAVVQQQIAPLNDAGARLRALWQQGLLHRSLPGIGVDLHHMHFNRLGVHVRHEMSLVLLTAQGLARGLLG